MTPTPDNSPTKILKKAIQKAIDNGWNKQLDSEGYRTLDDWEVVGHYNFPGMHVDDFEAGEIAVNDIIFNHNFAKALWGEKSEVDRNNRANFLKEPWVAHLQQMVIAEDPIKYLGENI